MKLLLYCTKSKPYLIENPQWIINMGKPRFIVSKDKTYIDDLVRNGKIVAECDFEVEDLHYSEELLKKSCLTAKEIFDYIKNSNTAYEIHIKNLHVFDTPRTLLYFSCARAPQNMMYVYDGDEKKVLISIRPEWLCKILNGEKTIEVRKKVLKEMLK